MYIDYGNHEEIPLSQIRPLPPQFCSLPAQALSCSLHTLEPSSFGRAEIVASLHQWLSIVLTGARIHVMVDAVGPSNDAQVEAYVPSVILLSEESVGLLQQLLGDPPTDCQPIGLPSSIRLTPFMKTLSEHYASLYIVAPPCAIPPSPLPPPSSPPPQSPSLATSQNVSPSPPASHVPPVNDPEEPLPSQPASNCDCDNQPQGELPGESSSANGDSKTVGCQVPKCASTPCDTTDPCNQELNMQGHAEILDTNNLVVAYKSSSLVVSSTEELVTEEKATSDVCEASSSHGVDMAASKHVESVSLFQTMNTMAPMHHTPLTLSDLPLLKLGLSVSAQFSLLVSHAVNPSCVYVHPVLQGAQDLLQLETLLKEHYSDPSHQMPLPSSLISPGALCCIQSGDDQLWYRAVVCESTLPTRETVEYVQVMFVDYGLTRTVPSTALMLLEPSFTSTAIQCICCSLDGIRPPIIVKEPEHGRENSDRSVGSHLGASEHVEGGKAPSPDESPSVSPRLSSSTSSATSSSPVGLQRGKHIPIPLAPAGDWGEAAVQLLLSLTEEKQLVGTVTHCFGE